MIQELKTNADAIATKNQITICLLLLLLLLLDNSSGCLAFLPSSSKTMKRLNIIRNTNNKNHHQFAAASTQLEYMEFLSQSASDALNRKVKLTKTADGGGPSGGGGATTSVVMDVNTSEKYFVKAASKGEFDMLQAEFLGVKAMANTNTIKVPEPICTGVFESGITQRSFVMFEYLEFTSSGGGDSGISQYDLGVQLAKVSHK
jgi:hypothetical protein